MTNKTVTRDHSTDWPLPCPACHRLLEYQPRFVQEIRNPHFKCRFCDATGEAVWRIDGKEKLTK